MLRKELHIGIILIVMALIGTSISLEVLQAEVPISGGDSPVGTQPEKPVPAEVISGVPRLTPPEQKLIRDKVEDTVANIELNSPPGSDPIQEGKIASELRIILFGGVIVPPEKDKENMALIPKEMGKEGTTPLFNDSGFAPDWKSTRVLHDWSKNSTRFTERNKQDLKPNLDPLVRELFELVKKSESSLESVGSKQKEVDQKGSLDQKAILGELDQEVDKKIQEVVVKYQMDLTESEKDSHIFVLDAVEFTGVLKVIDRFVHPPARLHPWLRWLLYLKHVTPETLQYYQTVLEQRDRIYMLAVKSDGKLKIRYQGRIMDAPIYLWPDQAEGRYELVIVGSPASLVDSQSSSEPLAAVAPPTS